MPLKDYIGPKETIRYVFRMGFEYYFYVLVAVLGSLFVVYLIVQGSILEWAVLVAAVWVILYRSLYYYFTVYFVTETYIYKKQGIFRRKLTAIREKEIENLIINKGFLERILFNAGSIRINIKGSQRYTEEMVLKRIAKPEKKVQRMKSIWGRD